MARGPRSSACDCPPPPLARGRSPPLLSRPRRAPMAVRRRRSPSPAARPRPPAERARGGNARSDKEEAERGRHGRRRRRERRLRRRGSLWALRAYREGRLSRGWRRLRVLSLGGVTTLDQREVFRTLSCGHVFHLRKSAKYENNIDDWLRQNRMRCPVCCKIVFPVLPWKAPTASEPPAPARSPSTTDLEAQLPRLPALQGRRPLRPPSEWFEDTLLTPSQ